MYKIFHSSAKLILTIIGFQFILYQAAAQQISLEEIWSGKFYPKSIENFVSTKDGKYYTILTEDGIEKYSYKSFQKTETVVQGKFSDYHYSPDEQFLLLEKKATPIYRRSKSGIYELYNIRTQSYSKIFDRKFIQEPLFSPDGSKIAFAFENNIYYQDLASGKVTQVTTDGEKNKIINGISDWVYEEELGLVRNFHWSPDGKYIAYVRFDESKVKEVEIPIYNKNLYPDLLTFKYPKAGEENSKVSLHIYNLENNTTVQPSLNTIENYYIVQTMFSPNGNLVFITSNRLQNKIDISTLNPIQGTVKKLFSESSKTWIDIDNIFLGFMENGNFIINSGRSGFNHLYLYSQEGKLIQPVTKGNWEVTELLGIDKKNQIVFFRSTEKGANNRVIGASDLKTEKQTILTTEKGTHEANFSADFSFFIDKFSTANTPPVYTLRDKSGNILKTLEDNAQLLSFASKKEIRLLEFIDIPNKKGDKLNAYIIKPKNFDSNKKYPVLMYTYGGPGFQTVNNSWDPFNYWWYQMLAQQGYIIVSADGRGTGGRGENFKKITYKNLGKFELEDQIAVAEWLKTQPYVDKNRIGIWGWSFGGYLTSLCMTKGEGTFKTGIAVAPVTNWRFYDTIYTERFLQTPQENPTGYDTNSPINFAQNLQGNYLIIHGIADDNVHFQNSAEMINALVNEGKQFDMAIYPDKNHGIFGGKTRFQLYQKMTNYIKANL